MDYISSCSSSNKKRRHHLLHHPVRWLAAADGGAHRASLYDSKEEPHSATSQRSFAENSETVPMAGVGQQQISSMGSCAGWTKPAAGSSLVGHCPTTPSPVCSPSLNATSDDEKGYASPDGIGGEDEERREEMITLCTCQPTRQTSKNPCYTPLMKEGGRRHIKQHRSTPRSGHKTKARSAGRHFSRESVDPFDMTGECETDDLGTRLTTFGRRRRGRRRNRHRHHCTIFSPFSSDGGGEHGGWHDDSDAERMIEEYRGSAAQAKECFVVQKEVDEVEAKLLAWKEARTTKVIDKLRRKEATIDDWEQQQITKAKMAMKNLEMRLEKERLTAMEKMQRRISSAREKAEKKKLRERVAATKKIDSVAKLFKEISSGKHKWKLLFL